MTNSNTTPRIMSRKSTSCWITWASERIQKVPLEHTCRHLVANICWRADISKLLMYPHLQDYIQLMTVRLPHIAPLTSLEEKICILCSNFLSLIVDESETKCRQVVISFLLQYCMKRSAGCVFPLTLLSFAGPWREICCNPSSTPSKCLMFLPFPQA